MSIRAAQLIYGSVEPSLSPRRIGGFQTLYYTHDLLSADEVEEIEPRLVFAHPTPGASKTVFFITSTGSAVIARIHAIEGTDSAGRGGRYVAHALVISPEDFRSIGCNPFRVLDRYSFVTSLEDALSIGDMRTGAIPAADIDASEGVGDDLQAASDMDSSVLMTLIRCALLADTLREERASAVFWEGEGHMLSVLRGLFAVLPVSVRSRCCFDTEFRDCNRASMYHWALGLPDRAAPSESDVVVGRSDAVAGRSSPTMYERWISGLREEGLLSEVVAQADQAFALDALSGTEVDQVPRLDAGFLRQYLRHVWLTKGELVHLVAALVCSGNCGLLGEMIPYVANRPPDVRRLVFNTVKGRQGIPESFMDALGRDARGLLDRVRGMLRR